MIRRTKRVEKITDYKEYVLTVASEMKPGVIWSEGRDYLKEVYPVKKRKCRRVGCLRGYRRI